MFTHKRESKFFFKNLIYFFKHQSSILGKIRTLLDFLTRILWVSIVFNFNYIWPVGGMGCADCSELKASKGLKIQPWWPLKSLSLSFGAWSLWPSVCSDGPPHSSPQDLQRRFSFLGWNTSTSHHLKWLGVFSWDTRCHTRIKRLQGP